MKRKSPMDDPWAGLAIVGAVGADLAVCVTAGFFLGRWAGARFGFETAWTLGGVVLGLIAGGVSVYFLVKRFVSEEADG